MAALTDNERAAVGARWGQVTSEGRESVPLTKPQRAATIAAIDDWIEANIASLNAALPVAARTGLSLPQKLGLFVAVLFRKFGGRI